MTPAALGAVLLLALVPAAALSAPACPGPDMSVPPEGATSVEVRHADVPNARFPGQWQQGRLGALSYRLYPGGFGTIGPGPHMEAWRIEISCNPDNRTCTYWTFGAVPEGMQPRARHLASCLLDPAPRKTPPAPAPWESAPPAAEPKSPARQPAPAAPKAAGAATPTAPEPAAPGTLAREPAPASPETASRPARAARETAPAPGTPRTLTREPAPAAPNGPTAAEPGTGAPEPAAPPAGPRTPARAAVPAPREAAPPLAGPKPFLCWTVPEVGGTGTPGSDMLVCRPAPVPPDVSAAPAAPSPAREMAAPPPVPQPPARPPAGPEGGPGDTRPSADPAGSQRPPEPAPQGLSGGAEDRPAPAGNGRDAAPPDADDRSPASDGGVAAAPRAPPAPRAAGAAGSPRAAPLDAPERVSLLPLLRPPRDQDRRPPFPGPALAARPAAPARLAFRARIPPPLPRAVQRPQPPATPPPLALTRCAVGSAMALGREDIGEIGQISVNMGCSGRIGDRLTFSGGLTGYPVHGARHGSRLTYSYALNWRVTDKVTLTYANYTAALAGGRALAGLGEGRLQLSARIAQFPLATPAMPDRRMTCTGFVGLARRASAHAGVNCAVNVTERLTVRFAALAYPPGAQDEGDADFSYSASYALSDRVTLTYSNYANNRWPWNRSPGQVEPFHGGTLGLSYRWDF